MARVLLLLSGSAEDPGPACCLCQGGPHTDCRPGEARAQQGPVGAEATLQEVSSHAAAEASSSWQLAWSHGSSFCIIP